MTSIDTKERARTVKQQQVGRAERVCSPEFLERHVRPYIETDTATGGDGQWSTTVIQLDGSGAATVRVELGGSRPVFAKLFPFDDGPAVHDKLQALRAAGLGAGRR